MTDNVKRIYYFQFPRSRCYRPDSTGMYVWRTHNLMPTSGPGGQRGDNTLTSYH